jgi:hypothetical protein
MAKVSLPDIHDEPTRQVVAALYTAMGRYAILHGASLVVLVASLTASSVLMFAKITHELERLGKEVSRLDSYGGSAFVEEHEANAVWKATTGARIERALDELERLTQELREVTKAKP